MHFSPLIPIFVLSMGARALLDLSTHEALNRYIPDASSGTVAATLNTDPYGFLQVGEDGVMRSISGNGTVIDYHQLDPTQLQEFAERQLHAWDVSAMDVPDDVRELATPPFADGRLVLEKGKLLHYAGAPGLVGRRTSRSASETVVEKLRGLDKRQDCIGKPCAIFNECASYRPTPCMTCYFPRGPVGMCLLE